MPLIRNSRVTAAGQVFLFLAVLSTKIYGQERQIVITDTPRPLAAAALELEHKYGVLVNYEDPPYEYSGDMMQYTPKPGKGAVVVPAKRNSFSISLLSDNTERTARNADFVSSAVNAYNALENPEKFRFVQHDDVFTILPTQGRDRAGLATAIQSPLDVPITIASESVSLLAAIEMICDSINAALKRQTVVVGTIPTNLFLQRQVTLSADNTPARTLLEQILPVTAESDIRAVRYRVVWRLLYGPDTKVWALNIHIAQREAHVPGFRQPMLTPIR
ncbi:MAG: hypothetical protein JOZ62_00735 [Acidobacteriaceae bacterium]|nr:hypothetical protein [Acidobacteriaceae bacterium]